MIEAAIILFSIVGCIIFIYFISDLSPPGKLTRVTTSRHGTLYLLHPSLMSFGILVLMSSSLHDIMVVRLIMLQVAAADNV